MEGDLGERHFILTAGWNAFVDIYRTEIKNNSIFVKYDTGKTKVSSI